MKSTRRTLCALLLLTSALGLAARDPAGDTLDATEQVEIDEDDVLPPNELSLAGAKVGRVSTAAGRSALLGRRIVPAAAHCPVTNDNSAVGSATLHYRRDAGSIPVTTTATSFFYKRGLAAKELWR